jgi:hypothetical protein
MPQAPTLSSSMLSNILAVYTSPQSASRRPVSTSSVLTHSIVNLIQQQRYHVYSQPLCYKVLRLCQANASLRAMLQVVEACDKVCEEDCGLQSPVKGCLRAYDLVQAL